MAKRNRLPAVSSYVPPWLTGGVGKEARQQVNQQVQPYQNELDRQKLQAEQQAQTAIGRTGAAYNALGSQLAPMGPAYSQQVQGIGNDLTSQIGALGGLLGQTAPAPELEAAGNYLGSIGAGGLELLASDRARNAAYQTSALRQGSEMRLADTRNTQAGLQDTLQGLQQQRLQLAEQLPGMLQQQTSDLQNQRLEQLMTIREYMLRRKQAGLDAQSNKAFNEFLQSQIGGILSGGGGGGGGGGFGGGGGGGGGGKGGGNQPLDLSKIPVAKPAVPVTPNVPAPKRTRMVAGIQAKNLPPALRRFLSGDLPFSQAKSGQQQRIRGTVGKGGKFHKELARYFASRGYAPNDPGSLLDFLRELLYGGNPAFPNAGAPNPALPGGPNPVFPTPRKRNPVFP